MEAIKARLQIQYGGAGEARRFSGPVDCLKQVRPSGHWSTRRHHFVRIRAVLGLRAFYFFSSSGERDLVTSLTAGCAYAWLAARSLSGLDNDSALQVRNGSTVICRK
jgi:hypothetical protein